LAFTASA